MQTNEKDSPNVVAPPPLIFLGGLLAGGILKWLLPSQTIVSSQAAAIAAGVVLVVAGLATIAAAISQMRRAKTNVEPWKPTTAILDAGLYGISRNPIYAAMVLIYLGASLLFNSVWFLLPLALVLPTIHYGVIRREEKYLERKFGGAYLDYKRRVRRWL